MTTTTVGSFSDGTAQRWLADKASSEMKLEIAHPVPGLADVRIDARSPTDVRFRAASGQVVPPELIRRVTVTNHGRGAIDGVLMGAAQGVAFGVAMGLVEAIGSNGATADCEDICLTPFQAGVFAGVLFGVPMMVLGLITGAIKGHDEVLELR